MTGAGRTVHRDLTVAVTGTRQAESRRGVLAELFERVLAPFADGPAADSGRLLGGAAGRVERVVEPGQPHLVAPLS
ncbi:hypothetical protein [Streptomyces sp. NPDC017095]|uniref:hypothetical protein n=1 Tax=Streptomyces sp. NPDC017095 TaxID=3364977 RepID=UPI003791D646